MANVNFIDYFDKIYVINLIARADRRDEMDVQLKKLGYTLNHPKIIVFNAIKPANAEEFPCIGARGCFLSHLGVLKHAQINGYKNILIFEDDLDFSTHFVSRSEKVLLSLNQNNWEIFYGDYRLYENLVSDENAAKVVTSIYPLGTTNFLGLKSVVIKPIIDYFELILSRPAGHPQGGPMHVDGAYNCFRKDFPTFNTIIATPALGFQRSSFSDITAVSWKNKLPFIQLIKKILKIVNYQRYKKQF